MYSELLIVKIGGGIINHEPKLTSFLQSFAKIDQPKILIHGGGKSATKLNERLGIATRMIEGRRVTSDDGLEVVTMVYAGLINKKISALLQSYHCNALGLSGSDANSIIATKRPVTPIDYGWVGDIRTINNPTIKLFLDNNITPVFSAICHDGKGQLLNTNADTIAAEVAIAMTKNYTVKLIYCFEKQGVLSNINDDNSVIEKIDTATYEQLKADGKIDQGMLPKLTNCFHALRHKVSEVKIGNIECILIGKRMAHTSLFL